MTSAGRVGVALLAVTIVPAALAAPPLRRISGTAERIIHAQGPCHGGVAVRDEEIAEIEARAQRVVLARADFTVFRGSQRVGKPVASFATDRSGRFEIQLPKGEYCVVAGKYKAATPAKTEEPPAAAATAGPNVDANCLRDLALACDASLSVHGRDARGVKVTLHTFTPCPQPWAQPCYRGPMPP